MTKLEHYKRYLKDRYPNIPQDYNESEGYFYHDFAQFGWQAWQASPKTRPTEPSKISKEQLAAMRADTSDIVDHLRGIYPGIASPYPVTPLQMKAADEIERLLADAERLDFLDCNKRFRMGWSVGVAPLGCLSVTSIIMGGSPIREAIDAALNKKPAEAGLV